GAGVGAARGCAGLGAGVAAGLIDGEPGPRASICWTSESAIAPSLTLGRRSNLDEHRIWLFRPRRGGRGKNIFVAPDFRTRVSDQAIHSAAFALPQSSRKQLLRRSALFFAPAAPPPPIAAPLAPTRRPIIETTSPERYRVQFAIGKESHDKLRRVQDLLRREIPDGDPAAIFDRAITLLLEKVEKAKLGAAAKPRAPRPIRPGTD